MKYFDDDTAHRLLRDCGLTKTEIWAALQNPSTTMLILPILERIEQIESQLKAER